MRTTKDEREALFGRIKAGERDELEDLIDASDELRSMRELSRLVERMSQHVTDLGGIRLRFGEAVEDLKHATGADGWIGAITKETAAAVVEAQNAAEQMQRVSAATAWVRDLEKARDVVAGATEAVRLLKDSAEMVGSIRTAAKEALEDARKTLRIAESLIAEAPIDDEEKV